MINMDMDNTSDMLTGYEEINRALGMDYLSD